jgi:hypothetical protein
MYQNSEAGMSRGTEVALMKTVLESFAPVLEKSALSVEKIEIDWLEPDHRFLLNVHLQSRTPYHFSLHDLEDSITTSHHSFGRIDVEPIFSWTAGVGW